MTTLAIPMTTPTPHSRSRPAHLQLYPSPSPPSSVSSSVSFLSTSSSLSSSSTFSDISVSSLASIPSPPHSSSSKTHAFFASPFPTRPPTPPQQTSKTADFFAIPSIAIDISTPTTQAIQIQVVDTSDEPTPRPPNLEPTWPASDDEPHAGSIISDPAPSPITAGFTSPGASPPPATTLRLLRPLGHGAFSSVWLADDLSPVPLVLKSRRSLRDLRAKSQSHTSPGTAPPSRASSLRKLRARVRGTSPVHPERLEHGLTSSLSRSPSTKRRTVSIEDPPASPGLGLARSNSAKGRLVAVKMTLRGGSGFDEEAERTRVAFVREVEVLKHISHPNITPLLAHLTTPTHHVLVLPFLPGGDLLALVNADAAWTRLRESVLQRIWAELCRAVAWMHGVGLVHRDIKLENILLTTTAYSALTRASPAPSLADLPPAPAPLIKLTDFGLSRFVDIRTDEERRADREARRRTRRASRGSTSTSGSSVVSASGSSVFTGRESSVFTGSGSEHEQDEALEDGSGSDDDDEGPLLSTRCGSEAYAAPELVMGGSGGRRGVYDARETDAWACGVVLYALVGRRLPFGEGVGGGGGGGGHGIGREGEGGGGGRAERRHWLMRIARGEYEWPEHAHVEGGEGEEVVEGEELVGRRLVESAGARRIVGRLLVRDPRKRARVAELFGDAWMGGDREGDRAESEGDEDGEGGKEEQADGEGEEGEEIEMGVEEELEMELALEEEEAAREDGWIVEKDSIDAIARREVV